MHQAVFSCVVVKSLALRQLYMQLDLLLNQRSVRQHYLWMLQMHSTPLTAKLHCTTSDAYAHPLPPYSSTHTEVPLSFSLMEMLFYLKKALHKETPWPCLCMVWQPSHLFENWTDYVNRYGTLMTLLPRGLLSSYMHGGTDWLQEVQPLDISPIHLKPGL